MDRGRRPCHTDFVRAGGAPAAGELDTVKCLRGAVLRTFGTTFGADHHGYDRTADLHGESGV